MFSDLTSRANRYTLNLTNCQVQIGDLSGSFSDRFEIEYGFLYNTPFTSNASYLGITSDSTSSSCVVNMYFPLNTSLPQIVFNIKGDDQSIQIKDGLMSSNNYLNFSRGIQISGEIAHISFSNHFFSSLNITLTVSFCYLSSI